MSSHFFTPQASQDINQIYNFIAKDKPSAAKKLLDVFEEKCQTIGQFPNIGKTRKELGRNIQSLSVENYIIFYRFNGKIAEVLRVLHGARDINPLFQLS